MLTFELESKLLKFRIRILSSDSFFLSFLGRVRSIRLRKALLWSFGGDLSVVLLILDGGSSLGQYGSGLAE